MPAQDGGKVTVRKRMAPSSLIATASPSGPNRRNSMPMLVEPIRRCSASKTCVSAVPQPLT